MVLEKKRLGVQPQNGIPDFSSYFPKELSYGYFRFEGNGKNGKVQGASDKTRIPLTSKF